MLAAPGNHADMIFVFRVFWIQDLRWEEHKEGITQERKAWVKHCVKPKWMDGWVWTTDGSQGDVMYRATDVMTVLI